MFPQIQLDLSRFQTFWNLVEIHDAEPASGYEPTFAKDLDACVGIERQSHTGRDGDKNPSPRRTTAILQPADSSSDRFRH
jgi:hypothetical protein